MLTGIYHQKMIYNLNLIFESFSIFCYYSDIKKKNLEIFNFSYWIIEQMQ